MTPAHRLLGDEFGVIARQTAAGLAWTGVAMLLGFGIRLVLARKMTPYGMGTVLAAQSFAGLALACAELGIPDAVVRYVGRDATADAAPRRTVLAGSRVVAIAGFIATAAALAVLWGWMARSMSAEALWTITVFALALPLLAAGDVLGAAFRGINRLTTKLVIADVARPALVIATVLVAPTALTTNPVFVAGAYFGAALLTLIAFGLLFKYEPRWRDGGVERRELLRYGLPLAAAAVIAGPLVNNGLPLMLTAGPGPAAVALFAIALSLQSLVYLPIGVFEQAVVPIWSRAAEQAPQHLGESYRHFAHIGLAAAACIGIVIVANDRAILTVLFGPSYAAAAPAVRIAILATIFGAFTGPNEGMLRALGRSAAIFRARTVAAVAGVAAGLVLVPPYGLMGAIAGFAVTTVAVNALYAWSLFRDSRIHPVSGRHLRSTIIMAIGFGAAIQSPLFLSGGWLLAHGCVIALFATNAEWRAAIGSLIRPR